jgi:DNA-binding response OmpR family regulator
MPEGRGAETARLVLIAEDDRKTASLLALYLGRAGFRTVEAADGEGALALARELEPEIIVLDLMLPGIDGWEVCRRIRRFSDVPILILTARDKEAERVAGLSLGADDYVVKPFSPREVLARVEAILRRSRRTQQTFHGELVIERDKKRVLVSGEPVSLTPSEFKLMDILVRHPGTVFTREELLDHLYPRGEAVVDRVVDVHIGKLRQKIERDPARPRYILTVRGFGYRFTDRED